MAKKKRKIKGLNVTTIILFSFLLVILLGAGLLVLPFSSGSGQWTDFTTALFTATSATCVTGLIVVDTGTYWSTFGKVVILLLIQIGGLGIMTIISLIAIIFAKSSSLRSRNIAMQAAGAESYQTIKAILVNIFVGTAVSEFIGAVVLSIRFIPKFGVLKGIGLSFFHSISAFCNAGFDIFGTDNGGSLMQFADDPLVLITIALLIIVGGIGFIVWGDVVKHGVHLKKYTFHSKITLSMTLILLVFGTGFFWLSEKDFAFENMPVAKQALHAFFQATTLRTAGFAAVDQANLSSSGTMVSYVLMFIGGSSGSTAGGIKTTTFAVLVLTFITTIGRREHIVIFKKKISDKSIKDALAIATIYLFVVISATIAICKIDGFTAADTLFETVSAMGTVGLTKGITSGLSPASRYIIILLMFVGRIGGLSFVLAFSKTQKSMTTERPNGPVIIG